MGGGHVESENKTDTVKETGSLVILLETAGSILT